MCLQQYYGRFLVISTWNTRGVLVGLFWGASKTSARFNFLEFHPECSVQRCSYFVLISIYRLNQWNYWNMNNTGNLFYLVWLFGYKQPLILFSYLFINFSLGSASKLLLKSMLLFFTSDVSVMIPLKRLLSELTYLFSIYPFSLP